ncbi:MAG TPA: quinone-dependent dihydroorotate dehydrogenase [Chitinophagales bacterium]|nr:quinone-dependent dihydroorotate dehydrogenase [Chitinophagales bacterium]
MYKIFIRPLLFLLPPETAHHYTLTLLKVFLKIPLMRNLVRMIYSRNDAKLRRNVYGLEFPNPVGLAAGFDKNALYMDDLACFGFGFIEIGTVTPLPQPGNEKPRLFRLSKDHALINRMGFNNDGVQVISERLKKRKSKIIIGGNIGKNKNTPNENAADDYLKCFTALFDYVDYFVVNVSSPNTPGLRELQDKEPLLKILKTLQEKNNSQSKRKPILLKIAPDLTPRQLDDIIEIAALTKIDGLVATNTTISRENLVTEKRVVESIGAGGLSGSPLREKATGVIHYLSHKTLLPIIGAGGIMNARDGDEKIKAGASLLQVYTGFVYEGPALVKRLCQSFLQII